MLAREFLVAGRASFTVTNRKGEIVEIKISRPTAWGEGGALLVRVRMGQGKWDYAGQLDRATGNILPTKQTDIGDRPRTIAAWAIQHIFLGAEFPAEYVVNHTGYCAKCGEKFDTGEYVDVNATGLHMVCPSEDVD